MGGGKKKPLEIWDIRHEVPSGYVKIAIENGHL